MPGWIALQVATAIRGAIILAKMSVVPVRRGYWGNKIGSVHTVPAKVPTSLLYNRSSQRKTPCYRVLTQIAENKF